MRNVARRSICLFLFLVLTSLVGCRLPGTDGPVSRSLVTSRQLSQRGVSALDRGEDETAETLLGQAVESCPVDVEARRNYAEALWRRGKGAQAIKQLDEASRLSAEDDTLLVRAAEMRLAQGDLEGAQRNAALAIDLNPLSAAAWAMQGRLQRRAGRPREALAAFHRSLSYEAGDRDVLLNLAETYRELNEPQRALVNLENLADTYSPGEEPQQVLYLEGLAMFALGRDAEAIENLAAASQRGRPSAEILFRLAEVQLHDGRLPEAQASAQRALAIQPNHGPTRSLLGALNVAGRPSPLGQQR